MDQLLAMRAFARVVEAGSFTRAADSLDMPNATVSKLVQDLEAHLGALLLQRTTRRVTVTPEGQEYYAKATRILRDVEDIDLSFNATRGKPRGHLRIDVGGSTASDVLIPLLPDFLARFPDIRIDLGVSDRSVDLISDNVDCVIRGGALENSTLVARHIGSANMITCAQTGRVVPFRFACDGEKTEIKIAPYIGVNESNAHMAACLAGLGIAQTFSYAADAALRQGRLVEILGKWAPPAYPFHVVYPSNRHVTQRLRVFIEWLLEMFPSGINGASEI